MFVQQQNEFHKITMDKVVNFFQICHTIDQLLCLQQQCEAAARKEHKETKQERDAADKKDAAA